jgi:HAD superfamily phosphatase (TIGR01668 family)
MSLFIASNTHNPKRLRVVAEELGIPSLERISKPRRKGLRAAMDAMGSSASTTAMIGDQIFTDIVGGNRLSLFTILVRPMNKREFFGTKISRLFEKPILVWLGRHGVPGTKGAEVESEIQD